MNPIKLKDWIEVVGIFALVGSLVFVGLQMKQAQDIAIAEQYQSRAIAAAEHLRWYAENDLMRDSFTESIANLNEIDAFESEEVSEAQDPDALATAHNNNMVTLINYDDYFKQFELGTMDAETWASFRYRLKSSFGGHLFKWSFTSDPMQWRDSFQQLCLKLISEIESENDALAS
jgi:hypothetical protein